MIFQVTVYRPLLFLSYNPRGFKKGAEKDECYGYRAAHT